MGSENGGSVTERGGDGAGGDGNSDGEVMKEREIMVLEKGCS